MRNVAEGKREWSHTEYPICKAGCVHNFNIYMLVRCSVEQISLGIVSQSEHFIRQDDASLAQVKPFSLSRGELVWYIESRSKEPWRCYEDIRKDSHPEIWSAGVQDRTL